MEFPPPRPVSAAVVRADELRELRKTAHDAIRKTVERVAPPAPTIDQTRVLSLEEVEELQRQTAAKQSAQELARSCGSRQVLRERLKAAVTRYVGEAPA